MAWCGARSTTEVPPKVEYSLTPPAVQLAPILGTPGEWFREQAAELRTPESTAAQV